MARPRVRKRRSRPRKRTTAPKRFTRAFLREQWALIKADGFDEAELDDRPRQRGDCRGHAGPCPWVACKHHLYLDINPNTGSITLNFPDLEPWELVQTCSLDIAERGGSLTLDEIGAHLNITRERVRQIEVRALLRKVKPLAEQLGLREVEIGITRYTAMGQIEEMAEPGYLPSEVNFLNG